MRYLAIDRIMSKDNLIESSARISKVLKKIISDRNELSAEESQKIDELEKDIIKENVFRLVSVRTPIEEFTPVKFDMIFDYENLNDTETVNLTVSHILLRNYYLMQFPLGHHCEIIVSCESGKPKLFEKLMTDDYDSIKIGFCNQSDWKNIKNQLMESKVEFEKWKIKQNI
ncbi:hypothetical protein [Aquimarina longa]|uniref:hypothetical protein n=1 Tax=Aquimarina longa TaxID=1080221 RepID=UPI0007840A45|nr:hypothetical protein [Aquimarina longa]